MTTPILFQEYIWLVNTIYHAKKITFKEINDKWTATLSSGGMPMARSTFNRHRAAIQTIFGLIIECERSNGNHYYIENAQVLKKDTIQNWIFSTFSVNNVINKHPTLHNRILLESNYTSDTFLRQTIEAMKDNFLISLEYKKYGTQMSQYKIVEPYCIKLFKQRWYMLVKYHQNNEFRTLAFDRIKRMDVLNEKFELCKDFDAERYFKDFFGIVNGIDTKLERIVVRAYGTERFYLRDLPLHCSQQEITAKTDYSDFEYLLHPTLDFAGYIASRGNRLKVMTPQKLADDICLFHQKAMDAYTHKDGSI